MSYKISQSLIKAFAQDDYCPMKLKKIFIDKTHNLVVSESMQRGLYFETLCLGSGVHGKKVNDLPRKKNGDKKVSQERIDLQVHEFRSVLSNHKMKVLDNDIYIEKEHEKGIILNGTIDFTSPIWDDTDGPIEKALVDLKLTMNIYSQFGPYCWHFPHNMDHTQAYMYMHLWEQVHGEKLPFYYLVFDYKPVPEYKIIKKLFGKMEEFELKESIRKTVEKIYFHEGRGYFTNPSHMNCRNCPLQTQCTDFTSAKKIQTV